MPRLTLPLTPASSTDIRGQDGSKMLATLATTLELPPPALSASGHSDSSSRVSPPSAVAPDAAMMSPPMAPTAMTTAAAVAAKTAKAEPETSSLTDAGRPPYPVQPAEAVKWRRRWPPQTQSQTANDTFALPPPPTRSRKIIQMKPRTAAAASATGTHSSSTAVPSQPAQQATAPGKCVSTAGTSAARTRGAQKAPKAAAATAAAIGNHATGGTTTAIPTAITTTTTTGKRKQPPAASAASRKINRKTAHSLIERRRRSKMNEEFAVLKGLVPACTGEMHKLAILQAAIEYVRYLEDCIRALKAQRGSEHQQQQQQERHQKSTEVFDKSSSVLAGGGLGGMPPHLFTQASQDSQACHHECRQSEDGRTAVGEALLDAAMGGTGDDSLDDDDDGSDDGNADGGGNGDEAGEEGDRVAGFEVSAATDVAAAPEVLKEDLSSHWHRIYGSCSSHSNCSNHNSSSNTSGQTSPAMGPQSCHVSGNGSATAAGSGGMLSFGAGGAGDGAGSRGHGGGGGGGGGGFSPHSTVSSMVGSALTSPALLPQRDLDQEATAALLMLNSDRRGCTRDGGFGRLGGVGDVNSSSNSSHNAIGSRQNVDSRGSSMASGRGMSVQDLLST